MATTINNTASVTYGYGRAQTDVAVSNTISTNLIEEYSMVASKISNNQDFRNGENLVYQITVTNDGSSSLYNLTIADTLGGDSAPLTFVDGSATINLGDGPVAIEPSSSDPLTFLLSSPLVSGASATITYIAKVSLGLAESVTEIVNETIISANAGSPSGEVIEVTPNPSCTLPRASYADLTIQKEVSETEIITGQSFSYIITLTNSGSLEANGVIITDTLPDGFVVSEIVAKTGDTTTTFTTDDYTIEPTTNTLTLPTGGTISITVPAASGGVDGTTTVTITGAIS